MVVDLAGALGKKKTTDTSVKKRTTVEKDPWTQRLVLPLTHITLR
jgi:hypothetical protein